MKTTWGAILMLLNISPLIAQTLVQPTGMPIQPEASSMLQINSLTNINGPYTGFLPPRMDSVQRKAIGAKATAIMPLAPVELWTLLAVPGGCR
jgi:hypothetical protein